MIITESRLLSKVACNIGRYPWLENSSSTDVDTLSHALRLVVYQYFVCTDTLDLSPKKQDILYISSKISSFIFTRSTHFNFISNVIHTYLAASCRELYYLSEVVNDPVYA